MARTLKGLEIMVEDKHKTTAQMKRIAGDMKKAGSKLVMTNGCFDLIHGGHIEILKKARQFGDALLVAVNSDRSVQTIKPAGRPILLQEERLLVLASLVYVDYLVLFDEPDPLVLIREIMPDVLVKGGDWKKEDIIGGKEVAEAGGEVRTIPYLSGHSTTEIIKRIIERHRE
jgi:D-beta-D-heptose 7-phosphate kinase/D-beta-D-heptose 1-phosphate adenosyltransferase